MSAAVMPTTRWQRFKGLYRLWWNQCPRCNSDAPLVDSCHVCRTVQEITDSRVVEVRNNRSQYPPSFATKALWLSKWAHPAADHNQWVYEHPRSMDQHHYPK
jgi:hypothetical protein